MYIKTYIYIYVISNVMLLLILERDLKVVQNAQSHLSFQAVYDGS